MSRAYLGDRMVDGDFYFGRPWETGLNRFAPEVIAKGITLKILPLRKDAPIYIPQDRLPDFGGKDAALDVRAVELETEYEVAFSTRARIERPCWHVSLSRGSAIPRQPAQIQKFPAVATALRCRVFGLTGHGNGVLRLQRSDP